MNIKVERLADNSAFRIRLVDHSRVHLDITIPDVKNMARCVQSFVRSGYTLYPDTRVKVQAWIDATAQDEIWLKEEYEAFES